MTEVDLVKAEALVKEYADKGWEKGKFGIGSIQWTGERTEGLMKHYRRVLNKYNAERKDGPELTRLTSAMLLEAEGDYMLEELTDVKKNYILIYPAWRDANAEHLNSAEAAANAAKALCQNYEVPHDPDGEKAKERKNKAKEIYDIMTKTPTK